MNKCKRILIDDDKRPNDIDIDQIIIEYFFPEMTSMPLLPKE